MTKLKITLIIVSSVIAVLGGAYLIGNAAYADGVQAGISAVVNQCAKEHTTIYNGNTGAVMVCDGGRINHGENTPGKGLPEASRPIRPPAGSPGIYQDPKEQSI